LFKVKKTSDAAVSGPSKVLLYSHHGFGKTYQCRYYQEAYGRGLILSGEAGLKSIGDVDIDYLPFTSWDGKHDPENDVYSFRGICRMIASPEFKKAGYTWICLDSLTELSERLIDFLEEEHKGATNKFALWADYSRLMLGTLKWLRDMPLHVYVSCLAKEESDENGSTQYWPLTKGQAVSKHIPALFDHVFAGVRTTDKGEDGTVRVKRYFATDEVGGWHGKVRDPRQRLRPYEPAEGGIPQLLQRMTVSDEQHELMFGKTEKADG
jgi:hypothetical protein